MISRTLVQLSFALLVFSPTFAWSAAEQQAVPKLTSLQHKIVQRWLEKRPDFELASISTTSLSQTIALSDSLGDPLPSNYHPYFVVGDFNSDKKEDFAIITVNQKNQERRIVIFNGPLKPITKPAFISPVDPNDWLFFFYDYTGEPRLLVGVFASEGRFILVKGKTYEFEPHFVPDEPY